MPHPNRSRRLDAPARNPRPTEVTAARLRAGLEPAAAASLVFVNERAWQRWETDSSLVSGRMMPAASWWLFRLRTGQAGLADLPSIKAAE